MKAADRLAAIEKMGALGWKYTDEKGNSWWTRFPRPESLQVGKVCWLRKRAGYIECTVIACLMQSPAPKHYASNMGHVTRFYNPYCVVKCKKDERLLMVQTGALHVAYQEEVLKNVTNPSQ